MGEHFQTVIGRFLTPTLFGLLLSMGAIAIVDTQSAGGTILLSFVFTLAFVLMWAAIRGIVVFVRAHRRLVAQRKASEFEQKIFQTSAPPIDLNTATSSVPNAIGGPQAAAFSTPDERKAAPEGDSAKS